MREQKRVTEPTSSSLEMVPSPSLSMPPKAARNSSPGVPNCATSRDVTLPTKVALSMATASAPPASVAMRSRSCVTPPSCGKPSPPEAPLSAATASASSPRSSTPLPSRSSLLKSNSRRSRRAGLASACATPVFFSSASAGSGLASPWSTPTMSLYMTTGSTTALRTVCSRSSVDGPPSSGASTKRASCPVSRPLSWPAVAVKRLTRPISGT
mmetsp:Transcript_12189/g.28689  ORF Transcript_12189/g.28689 Transcript_12189/m.28689 type:complete len:212 (-) Transcript_12189:379-1014(-)